MDTWTNRLAELDDALYSGRRADPDLASPSRKKKTAGRQGASDDFIKSASRGPRTYPRQDVGPSRKLTDFLDFLTNPKTETQAAAVLKVAYETHMVYKKRRYTSMLKDIERDVTRERSIAQASMQDLRTASSAKQEDNWSIFSSLSDSYREATERASAVKFLLERIQENLSGAGVGNGKPPARGDRIYTSLSSLVDALRGLTDFAGQNHVVDDIVDVVQGFLKNPVLVRTKFLNMMITGPAGVGKTTMVQAIAKVFASAGMFVGDEVRVAGRAEFIGEYEGQTVARTRKFLLSSLDAGVVFVDEAYALTPWHDGKPSSYGAEAIAAIVEFTTKYKGLYCLMCAGYEKEMVRYFLPVNPGLERRFSHRLVLNSFTVPDLVAVFKKTLMAELGLDVKRGLTDEAVAEATDMFEPGAWIYLTSLLQTCRSGTMKRVDAEYDDQTHETYEDVHTFVPSHPHLYRTLIENQAGSMTNLAEEASVVLVHLVDINAVIRYRHKRNEVGTDAYMPLPHRQPASVMKDIVRKRLEKTAMSKWDLVKRELGEVEASI